MLDQEARKWEGSLMEDLKLRRMSGSDKEEQLMMVMRREKERRERKMEEF